MLQTNSKLFLPAPVHIGERSSNDHCEKFVQGLINRKIVVSVRNQIASLEELDGTVDLEEISILSEVSRS